jgi:PIN domain nuclease of toxin-antitoxin system
MKLLLDTCTFLWMTLDAPELSPRAREAILDAENELYLSAASVWEICVKHALGRLPLPEPPARFIVDQRAACGIASLPVDEESALHLLRLPSLHGDPFDRMLVSQALVHGLTLVTPDPLITQYPSRILW